MKTTFRKIIKTVFISFLCALCFSNNVVFAEDSKSTELIYEVKAKVLFINEYEDKTYEYEYDIGDKMIEPQHSDIEGYTFLGWYLDDYKWDFNSDRVYDFMTLKAKYSKNAKPIIPDYVIPNTGIIGLLTGNTSSYNILRCILIGLLICTLFVSIDKKNNRK